MKYAIVIITMFISGLIVPYNAIAESIGNWSYDKVIDRMTDIINVKIRNRSTDAVLQHIGDPYRPSLYVTCEKGKDLIVFLATGELMGKSSELFIKYDGKKITRYVHTGLSKSHVFVNRTDFRHGMSLRFFKEMSKHKSMLVQYHSHWLGKQTVEFDLKGVDEVSAKIMSDCHLK